MSTEGSCESVHDPPCPSHFLPLGISGVNHVFARLTSGPWGCSRGEGTGREYERGKPRGKRGRREEFFLFFFSRKAESICRTTIWERVTSLGEGKIMPLRLRQFHGLGSPRGWNCGWKKGDFEECGDELWDYEEDWRGVTSLSGWEVKGAFKEFITQPPIHKGTLLGHSCGMATRPLLGNLRE